MITMQTMPETIQNNTITMLTMLKTILSTIKTMHETIQNNTINNGLKIPALPAEIALIRLTDARAQAAKQFSVLLKAHQEQKAAKTDRPGPARPGRRRDAAAAAAAAEGGVDRVMGEAATAGRAACPPPPP